MTPLFLILALVAAALAACTSNDHGPQSVQVEVTAINDLVLRAGQDARNMEGHADAMTSLATARPDHAHWTNDAQTARANARSLRFLADSAAAIARDQAMFPAKGSAVDLGRLLGDGLNLQAFGRTLLEHAEAMSGHAALMRQDAAGDTGLLAVVTQFDGDVAAMRTDAQAAIDHGERLAETARKLARSTGVRIE
jgi:hypothetical protein